jgi:soluble lytic murein transglycosylase-like protein
MLDMFDGNVERALAAYNAGPARVRRTAGLPAISETRSYVASIIEHAGAFGPSRLAGVTP